MVHTLIFATDEQICPNGKFGSHKAIETHYLDANGVECVKVSFETANKMYVPTLLATLADYMKEWSNFAFCHTTKELVEHINKVCEHHIVCVEEYHTLDDWDDYLVLLIRARDYLKTNYVLDIEVREHFR